MRDEAPQEITADLLLHAYASGVFPMAESADSDEIFWIDPKTRGLLPLDSLHVSRSLRKRIRKGGYSVRWDSAFAEVVRHCSERNETWINPEIAALYQELYRRGHAHSVELFVGELLVGGLYGVSMGGAFFGESMFSLATDASKIALVYLVARLRFGGYSLLDTQFTTDHLISLGALEISRADYHRQLRSALQLPARYWALEQTDDPQAVLQLSTQMS
ncbi:leucyl/phenylalanyl-tRNA--protein transferase [Algicella marina]|uniref:Leucyl/phenylalanyl-tRNA--protein transferase n=1 Tax=Algicella marina TaxID=2683284 RepID=A0A6P1SY59_9RHOB|nr:leucyl/phenylalanyl-tRNA--protein transferase [Algicella marina]QHQ34687.1 leucyl/phenylalanyl-tRNA--protein transferase [Algicella marina]